MSSNTNAGQCWKFPASIISKRTSNPIRTIVYHIKAVGDKVTHPEAPLVTQDVILTSGWAGALDMCIGVL
ncbi:hypothetical protein KI688_002818 [Linnemannia hyalina]|uniref:Uncharacterized protein n=1 Tax=Linnemannia hyalina TaxID=64524 RepID=A0A9P7XNI2_9FUNG|nr:hypothetical protein KI688_002818 [Linnemannia hyalina]